MVWVQVIVIVGVFSAFFIYLLNKIDHLTSDIAAESRDFNNKFLEITKKMAEESKDFHARLCLIEEKYQDLKLNKKGIITK